jgi:hypothetical protein
MPDDNTADDQMTLTLFPVGTVVFDVDDINQVTIQFPDNDSAVFYLEWVKQLFIDTEKAGYES